MKHKFMIFVLLACVTPGANAFGGDITFRAPSQTFTTNNTDDADTAEVEAYLPSAQPYTKPDTVEATPLLPAAEPYTRPEQPDIVVAAPANNTVSRFPTDSDSSGDVVIISHFDPRHPVYNCITHPELCEDPAVTVDPPRDASGSDGAADVADIDDSVNVVQEPGGQVAVIEQHDIPTIDPATPPSNTKPNDVAASDANDVDNVDVSLADDSSEREIKSCPACTSCPSAACADTVNVQDNELEVSYADVPASLEAQNDMFFSQGGGCSLLHSNPSCGIISALILVISIVPIVIMRKP